MKSKTLLVVIAALALAIVIVLYALSLIFGGAPNNSSLPQPTPESSFTIVSSSISDGQTNVPLDEIISIKFNRIIDADSVSINILPTTNYTFEVAGDTVIITPDSLAPSTLYSLSMSYAPTNEFMASFAFTTLGPTPTFLPDTRPSGEPENTDELLLRTRPDVYLSNNLPYTNTSFSVDYEFAAGPPSHFAFNVTLLGDKNVSREDFLAWVRSKGLTDSQIGSLDITYN